MIPDPERKGETFDGFIKALTTGIPFTHPAFAEMCDALEIKPDSDMAAALSRGLGYQVEYKTLKSCDYGAPTSRTRLYLIARRDGIPIICPEPTHTPKKSNAVKYGEKLLYRTAAECIDWSIPAQSIFAGDKPLAENTLRLIARGIQKFVIENSDPFIVHYKFENEPESIHDPLSTITAVNSHYVVAPTLIQYHSEHGSGEVRGQALTEPIMTVDTGNRYALSCAHVMKYYAGGYTGKGNDAEEP